MRMVDIIEKKRDGAALSDEEIRFFIKGYTDGSVPDYQASALAMAIYFRGMTEHECACLTEAMAYSGDTADLSAIDGIKVDKHSTGGVGDKTTLVLAPIVASLGVPVAKMSGRGLGHTGGTLDKLESIPGLSVDIDMRRFFDIVNTVGCAVIGQTGNLVPADKKLYALRDVTATVDSVPLIASSIMSKKLAAGAQCILLDVKVGSGAFMKTVPDAVRLARAMVAIGEGAGRRVRALVTNMDRPLGRQIGNALEVAEVVRTLRGEGPADLAHEAVLLASTLLNMALGTPPEEGERLARAAIADGSALAKLRELVEAQGGDPAYIDDPGLFRQAAIAREVVAPRDGFIAHIDTERVGAASAELGAGRMALGDKIDPAAGITLLKSYGDAVRAGEPVAVLHADDEERLEAAQRTFEAALAYGAQEPPAEPLVYATISSESVSYAEGVDCAHH